MALLTAVLILAASAAAQMIVHRSTVFEHPSSDPYDLKNLHGFNHAPSVAALADGRLLCAWFSGPFEASVHQSILGSYSADQGRTWTPAAVLQDFPRRSDFDPALLADGGRLWLFFTAGRWNRYPFVRSEKEDAVGENSFQIYSRHTVDSGRTWSAPETLIEERAWCSRSNGIRLSSGELLLPVYKLRGQQAGVLKSSDGGRSWKRFGSVSTPAGQEEPSIAELRGGPVMMILRTGDGRLWQSVSRDKGETWSAAERTDIVAARASHNLFRLRDGRIALTHDASPPPHRTPLTLRLSSDDGATWSAPLVLAEIPIPGKDDAVWGRQVTYPSVAQLADGSLVAVWSEITLSDAEQYGDIRCARLRLDTHAR